MNNSELQSEELEVLTSIYSTDWCADKNIPNSYTMNIASDIKLFITLNDLYPSESPPSYEILAPYLSSEKKQEIEDIFNEICCENIGGPVLFQWIEKLKEIAIDKVSQKSNHNKADKSIKTIEVKETVTNDLIRNKFNIIHGPTIMDRKSVFQGHTCKVNSQSDVKIVMGILLENKKIAQATHNILAYRIVNDKGLLLKDCDDDGENKAGAGLLELLEVVNATNIMVVVSRWYGGIQLGPDRFRHIKNSGRQVLEEAGFLKR